MTSDDASLIEPRDVVSIVIIPRVIRDPSAAPAYMETYSTKVKRDHLGKVRTEKRNDINALNKESRN